MRSILIISALGLMAGHCMLRSELDESGEPGAAAPKGAAIRPDLTNYQTAKSASGSTTKHSGDAVAVALVGATLNETYGFVSNVVGIAEDVLREKYGKSNVGQQRMFLGNLIRGGMVSKEEGKADRIKNSFELNVADFRVAIDARLAKDAEERAAEVKRKADEKEAKKAEAKAARDAAAEQRKADALAAKQLKEDNAKAEKAAKAEADKAAKAKAKAPKEPATPAE